jgi:glycosidase
MRIKRQAREEFGIPGRFFSPEGRLALPGFHEGQLLAAGLHSRGQMTNDQQEAVRASDRALLAEALDLFSRRNLRVDSVLQSFAEEFPGTEGFSSLNGLTGDVANREILIEDLLILELNRENQAYSPFKLLFSDSVIAGKKDYSSLIGNLHGFLDSKGPFPPFDRKLIELLRSPALASPNSLSGQLEYIKNNWGRFLGNYLLRILKCRDFIREEDKIYFAAGAGAPAPPEVYRFDNLEDDREAFSPDREWMPRLVMIAKSVLVWLDQLAKKYQRPIKLLSDIPDEELDLLSHWGFSGLWLIGIWQRSPSSKQIKRLCGNPEAESSAYSLYDYLISDALGGEEGLDNLKSRCLLRGIRLASDMVPNHTGLDSRWMRENPDYFLSLDYSPYPAYSFTGVDLCSDPAIGLFIEDHYFDRSDAAVVFKRLDRRSGEVRYVYHGNDGTNMPWNDTAQLNYLNPGLREEVIRTILKTARKFPIIRFDAAMTLTRKHYQRLWFPEPGKGGDIPTRAEHGLSAAEFAGQMPEEFWREVVDRIKSELPDTLLLAEAFWMMEGYFVRTLGMHRVYNSAFMHMLKEEKNKDYRQLIKNTLEFDPQILKRYANFMNNPDEETAVVQFGKGDKYFGVCTMVATLPGLPLFGHGQFEGFSEKYGMEYSKAYRAEQPDRGLIEHHERVIVPLLRKRYLFSEVDHFRLYDLVSSRGEVNENVFVYSNSWGGERALVIYNNSMAGASGWIRNSLPYALKGEGGKSLHREDLAAALQIKNQENYFYLFKELTGGLEYLRRGSTLYQDGLYLELEGYKYQVFFDFREIMDNEDGHYLALDNHLKGRGVLSLEQALKELLLRPLLDHFEALCSREIVKDLFAIKKGELSAPDNYLNEVSAKITAFLGAARSCAAKSCEDNICTAKTCTAQTGGAHSCAGENIIGAEGNEVKLAGKVRRRLQALLTLEGSVLPTYMERGFSFLGQEVPGLEQLFTFRYCWIIVTSLAELFIQEDFSAYDRTIIDEYMLAPALTPLLNQVTTDDRRLPQLLLLLKILIRHQEWCRNKPPDLLRVFEDPEVQEFLQINRYQNTLWCNKESLESFIAWLGIISLWRELDPESDELLERYLEAAEKSGYRFQELLDMMHEQRSLRS